MLKKLISILTLILALQQTGWATDKVVHGGKYDVVIYGGTSAGVAAAVQVSRMGKTVVLIEPGDHLGGLSSGGLGWTDSGRKDMIGGISREFYQRVKTHYDDPKSWPLQKPESLNVERGSGLYLPNADAMWVFEPHVAEAIFEEYVKELELTVVRKERLNRETGVKVKAGRIVSITMESGRNFAAPMFIDATYEGDLMASAGVSYHVGRESNEQYGESLNGVQKEQMRGHLFLKKVDPYVVPGDPSSGLVARVHADGAGKDGAADHRVQAYNYRMCMSNDKRNWAPFPKPSAYDEKQYELLFRNFEAGDMRLPLSLGAMPNHKTDTNNSGAFSTDNIGMNYDYPEASYAEREIILQEHETYQKGLMWTLVNHPRVPKKIRDVMSGWGLAADEFADSGNWPHQIYVREARRMVGAYVTTELDCRRERIAKDSVGIGSYNMDSHNTQRYVTEEGFVQDEGDVQVSPGGPYVISYRSITPKKDECENLLVPVALSSSHIAYGSIRMEPVFMILGQSAATSAVMAIEDGLSVQEVPYARLRERLLKDGQVLDLPKGTKQKLLSSIPKLGDGVSAKDMSEHKDSTEHVSQRSPTSELSPSRRPNIIMIMADDLGYECLQCYGGRSYRTPCLNKLADEGMKFTHCFSAPYCSPSRAQLLTGRYPLHNGIKRVIHDPKSHHEFLDPTRETSFANLLQHAGYATAIAGKWQISFFFEHDTVRDFGFDNYQCWEIVDADHERNSRYANPVFIRNGKTLEQELDGKYGPDENVDFLIDFMKKNRDRPFLVYYPMLLPHFPWEPTPDSNTSLRESSTGNGNAKYFPDMVAYMDKLVGRITDAVDQLGLKENTLIIFTGDNGTQQPLVSRWGPDNRKVYGGKAEPSDAGSRVPLIARWPGKIKPNSVNHDLIDFSDFLPTFVELSQSELPAKKINGRSFTSQLFSLSGTPRQWVHVQKEDVRYVRSRDWILTDKNELRPVVEIGMPPARPVLSPDTPEQEQIRKELTQALAEAAFQIPEKGD
ncbi:MAG: FAD-dependent oxidoreductase [Verrucomicrobia bacterium]|nr:FAD-dependent oxidoreductase [Verrucomicrobiota bacterium]